jgi:hypothetical protein
MGKEYAYLLIQCKKKSNEYAMNSLTEAGSNLQALVVNQLADSQMAKTSLSG